MIGSERFEKGFEKFGGNWREMTLFELFKEMRLLLENLNLEKTIFRSDHASNHLVLKGILGRDKPRLLAEVDSAIQVASQFNR